MNISQAVATAAAAGDAKVRRAYAAAVSRGANNTLCTAEQEREYGTLRLPDLVLYSHLLEGFADDPDVDRVPPVVVGAVRTVAAGALRLAHRALETHGRDVGMRPARGSTGRWSTPESSSPGTPSRSGSRRCRWCSTSRGCGDRGRAGDRVDGG